MNWKGCESKRSYRIYGNINASSSDWQRKTPRQDERCPDVWESSKYEATGAIRRATKPETEDEEKDANGSVVTAVNQQGNMQVPRCHHTGASQATEQNSTRQNILESYVKWLLMSQGCHIAISSTKYDKQQQNNLTSSVPNLILKSIIDKTPTHALFIQHYISLACWFH